VSESSEQLGHAAVREAMEAAGQGNYEAAYHFLMAALHVADHAPDPGLVADVSRLAEMYRTAVDGMHPEHHLSTEAATRRGQPPLFESLQTHAKAVELRHRQPQARRS
jgi:hypothetical protein